MDKAAIDNDGLSEIVLMGRAGERVWLEISSHWPEILKMTVFAGAGNNGGDAFVVACLAKQQGVAVQLIAFGDLARQSATSAFYRQQWQKLGGEIEAWSEQAISGDIIVDGLLGIGLTRELNEEWQCLIRLINENTAPAVAIDIPSGLNAKTGTAKPCAIEAVLTVTFIGRKVGHYLADGVDYCGEIIYDSLGASSTTLLSQAPALEVIDQTNLQLPQKRKHNSHKNSFGHILVIGGGKGMVGACSLAAQAALRSGAGMVTVLVDPKNQYSLSASPELMVRSWDDVEALLERASVVLVGPGLGHCDAASACLTKLTETNLPMVIDADALTADFIKSLSTQQIVMTPHPGEAARLLSISGSEVQTDRLAASQLLSERFNSVNVLKGSGTIIRQSGRSQATINIRGNPGMASAGMGDVLAGMIAALIGQHMSLIEAARSAVLIHALCAEDFAENADQTGLIASDIIQRIPSIIKRLRDG